MQVQSVLPAVVRVSDQDLCVVLSNALENALHACQALRAQGRDCTIELQLFQRENRVFLLVSNPCEGNISFRNGVPQAAKPGHGIGVQSICAIAERYGGLWDFQVKDGHFQLRLSL